MSEENSMRMTLQVMNEVQSPSSETDSLISQTNTNSFNNSTSQSMKNMKESRALMISEETERKNIIRASQRSRRVDMSLELNNKKVCCCGPGWKRYIISILCCVCLTVVIGMRSEMLGIVTQLNKANQSLYDKPETLHEKYLQRFRRSIRATGTKESKSLYQSQEPRRMPWIQDITADFIENALFFAYLFGSPVGGYLTVRHDSSLLLGGSTAMTCTLNLFLPLVEIIEYNMTARICIIMILRILQGLAEGCLIPAVFGVLRFWGPESERSTLICLAMIGVSLGPLIGLPICVEIEDHWGWGVVFYIYANIGLIWCIFWWRLVDERPIKDKSVSQVERLYLESTITKRLLMPTKPKVKIPWYSIFMSKPVFAILVTYAADDWTFQISSVCMQAYYYQIFKTDVERTVQYLAFPFLSRSLFVPVGGFLADLLRLKTALPLTIIRKIFSILGFGLKGVFFIAMSFAQDEFLATIYLTLSLGFSGLAVAGYAVNVIDMSPEYAGLIMGFANSISTFTGILSTVIASLVVSNAASNDKSFGWMIAFFLAAASQFCAALCYLFFASCEEQSDWCKRNQYEEPNMYPDNTDYKSKKRKPDQQNGRICENFV